MKWFLGILGAILGLLVLLVGGGLLYIKTSLPNVDPAPNLTVEATPEHIARGKYLANHVTVCIDCHAQRDWKYYAGPLISGTEGQGGEEFIEDFGSMYSQNITPAAIGDWTDGEILWAMMVGVNREGEPLAPTMPYGIYRDLTQEDAHAIIAYVRTLAPIDYQPPKSELSFPFSMIVRTIPQRFEWRAATDSSNSVTYGEYLATISGCHFCHTRNEQGVPVAGMDFAGGFDFKFPGGAVVRSKNITPEKDTGIGEWNKEDFIGRFKEFLGPESQKIEVGSWADQTVMPWLMYAGMTERDLGAIYDYLQTVKPIRNDDEVATDQ